MKTKNKMNDIQKCLCPIWVKYNGPTPWNEPCLHCCFEILCSKLAKGVSIDEMLKEQMK